MLFLTWKKIKRGNIFHALLVVGSGSCSCACAFQDGNVGFCGEGKTGVP